MSECNAFILDWTMNDYAGLKQALAVGFVFENEPGAAHIRVQVPLDRIDSFAALCQAHLDAPQNYVDVQFPAQRRTVIIFVDRVFTLTTHAESEQARQWAIARGLPPEQADWPVSF